MSLFKGKREDLIKKDEAMLAAIEDGQPFVPVNRVLHSQEKYKRGCAHCQYARYSARTKVTMADAEVQLAKGERMLTCMFDHCPLHELDQYKDYREYLKTYEGKIEKALSKALKIKVETLKADEEELEEEPPKPIDRKTRWLIGVRRSQGCSLEQMEREFGLKRKQLEQEVKNYDKKHTYV